MRVLFTGASSFTGSWIVAALAAQGHRVVAPLRRGLADYDGLRRARMDRLGGSADVVEHCRFGSAAFLDLIEHGGFDLLCHHAAQVDNYRADDFDVAAAVRD